MAMKPHRFDVEWWIISKRVIYLLIILLVVAITAGGISIYSYIYGNPFKHIAANMNAPAGARFLSFDGDVRVVRAQTRESLLARSDTQLYPGDIVQTQADGRARIQLADGSTLLVRPNSVVTIRDNTSVEGSNRTNVRVAVARGQINVHTEQQTEGSKNVVETPLTKNNLAAQTGAAFGVREDNTEDIRVASGAVDTTTRGGEHTVLQPGEYVAFNQSGNVKARERLLDVPTPILPRDLEKIPTSEHGAATVSLRWQRPASGTPAHYRVEVATSPFFVAAGKMSERDQLDASEFSVGDLRPGVYFWRVRAVALSGQISEWSEPQKFTVTPSEQAFERVGITNVTFEYIAGQIFIARGRTQPGNTVRIAGRETIATPDGTFQLQFTTPPGTREVALEVEDAHGNKAQTRQKLAAGGG
ncbi:MAG: FecR domain-containing protein [Pyrinomonadaceae bacterium]